MANIKDIYISGSVPFCFLDEASERLLRFMAMFSMPAWGFRIGYMDHRMVPNANGGKTATYNFEIRGQEAISYRALIGDLAEMRKAGAVFSTAIVVDMETKERWDAIPEIAKAFRELEGNDEGTGVQGAQQEGRTG